MIYLSICFSDINSSKGMFSFYKKNTKPQTNQPKNPKVCARFYLALDLCIERELHKYVAEFCLNRNLFYQLDRKQCSVSLRQF